MKQGTKDFKATIHIGRDANGADIKINANDFSSIVNQQLELLLKKEKRFETTERKINVESSNVKKLIGEIDKLKVKINDIKAEKNPPNKIPAWAWIFIASIGGAIIFILVMVLFQKWLDFEVSYDNATTVVLAFVGIAATFVVVSNYAQVKDIENKFNEKVKEIKDEFNQEIEHIKSELITKIEKREIAINERINNISMDKKFEEFCAYYNSKNYLEAIRKLLIMLSSIDDIKTKNFYAEKATGFLQGIEIKASDSEKAVIESLSGISYPYGNDIPEPLRNIIKNIQI